MTAVEPARSIRHESENPRPKEPAISQARVTTVEPDLSLSLDGARGITERVSFFGPGLDRMFGCRYVPREVATCGVVICCPLQAELLRNYRREVILARRLAAAGIAVQRFHYRGAGHSDGETSEMTVQTMQEDALAAAEELRTHTGVSDIVFVGVRFASFVAVGAATTLGSPLVLWEPAIDPQRYFEKILRFRLMYEMKENSETPISQEAMLEEIHGSGCVDILGHTIEKKLYDSAIDLTLHDVGGIPALLLVHIGGTGSRLRPDYRPVVERWKSAGIEVDTQVIADREMWWLSGDLWPVHETHPPTTKLVETTAQWIVGRAGERNP